MITFNPESWFPGATGLEYLDKGEKVPVAVVERDSKFVEPRNGWHYADRVFHVIYEAEAAPTTAEPKSRTSKCCQTFLQYLTLYG